MLVERDLELMEHTASLIDGCLPFEAVRMLSLPHAVKNFADVMRRQVDLRIESDNLLRFRRNFGRPDGDDDDDGEVNEGWFGSLLGGKYGNHKRPPAIDFPRPIPGWVSENVLVEDYAGDDAVPISRYLSDDSLAGLETRRRLAGPLLRAFLKMVFVDNFIHVDLHPGNVLVKETRMKDDDGCTEKLEFSIVFLDAGIAMSLLESDQRNLRDLFRAVILNDGYTAGTLMVERARYERCTSIPGGKHSFASGVSNIVSEFHDQRKQGLTLGAVRIGALLARVLDLCRIHGVEIDPAMASVVVSTLVLEGLGRSLEPDLNLISCAMPFVLGGGKV